MATTTHYVTVCLYTATQLPNAEDVHVVTTIAEQEWKSSSKQGPVPDWEQVVHCVCSFLPKEPLAIMCIYR